MLEPSQVEALHLKAGQGDAEAAYELSWRHALGNGLPEDDPEAVRWLKLAAARGHLLACNNLGARHVSGEGVPQSCVEAWAWFHFAAERGDRKAGKNRDSVGSEMGEAELSEALNRAQALNATA